MSLKCRPAEAKSVELRLAAARVKDPFGSFENIFKSRIADADEFYERITAKSLNEDEHRVHRQALAGMLWSKQYYYFDLEEWLMEHKSSAARFQPDWRAEYGMVSHAKQRRDLHAGQMGVPLVRGLGPGLSHTFSVPSGF